MKGYKNVNFKTLTNKEIEHVLKRNVISSVIMKSLNKEAHLFNQIKIKEATELNTHTTVQSSYYIVSHYNYNFWDNPEPQVEFGASEQELLMQEKYDATIHYILSDPCIYDNFVETWEVDVSVFGL